MKKRILCGICHRYFNDISLLLHKKAKHTPQTLLSLSLQCIIWRKNTVEKRNMHKDPTASSSTEQGLIVMTCFTCKICNHWFKTELSLSTHYKSKHSPCTLLSQSLQCIIPRLKKNVSSNYIVDENGHIKITVNGHKIFFKLMYANNRYTIERIKFVTITRIKCDDLENHTTLEKTNSGQLLQPLQVKQDLFVKKEPKESKNTQNTNGNTLNNIKKINSNGNKCLVKKNKVSFETPSDKFRVSNKRSYEYLSRSQSRLTDQYHHDGYEYFSSSQNRLTDQYNYDSYEYRRKLQEITFKLNRAYEEIVQAERRLKKRDNVVCYFCNQRFPDGFTLDIHQDCWHGGQRTCRSCWQVLPSKQLLFKHLNLAHNIGRRRTKPLTTKRHLDKPAPPTAKRIKKEIIKVEVPSASDVKIEPIFLTKIKTEPLLTNIKTEPLLTNIKVEPT